MGDKLKACCAATGVRWSQLAREESEERIRYLERENKELRNKNEAMDILFEMVRDAHNESLSKVRKTLDILCLAHDREEAHTSIKKLWGIE